MSSPFQTTAQLESALSEPTPGVIETFRRMRGDLIFLGVAGKMGPTLARMARRASDAAGGKRRIIGVSRFSKAGEMENLQSHGIETVQCDLLDPAALARLPDAPNVVFMAGMKFGATGNESLTWAMNTLLPAMVCQRFSQSRIVAFSTGNVYGLTPVGRGGSVESDPPQPSGEYAMSCLGRERTFEHFSRTRGIPTALIRLNYACEPRYGVYVDLAKQVAAGETVSLNMGWFNILWQGDANAMALCCFDHVSSPPFVINMTGPERLGVREVSETLAARFGLQARFGGEEASTALLSNASRAFGLFGRPRVAAGELLEWVALWIRQGMPTLGKPTHFESRDGRF